MSNANELIDFVVVMVDKDNTTRGTTNGQWLVSYNARPEAINGENNMVSICVFDAKPDAEQFAKNQRPRG